MKLRKILAVLLAFLLLAACGAPADPTAPPATPAQTPAGAGDSTPPEKTPAGTETEPPAATDPPGESTPYTPPEVVIQPPAGEDAQEIWTYSDHYTANGPLQASDTYGALLPYVGRVLQEQGYGISSVPLYGLCTPKGELVTEGIYRDFDYEYGFLLLERWDDDGNVYTTLASQDGRWVTEEMSYFSAGILENAAVLQDEAGGLYVWNRDGTQTAHFPAEAFDPWLKEILQKNDWNALNMGGPFLWGRVDDVLYVYTINYNGQWEQEEPLWLYLDLSTQTVSDVPPDGVPETVDPKPGPSSVELPNGISAYPEDDIISGQRYYCSTNYETLSTSLYAEDGTLIAQGLASWNYFDASRVMAGLVTMTSAYKLETYPGWDLFDWYSLTTGEPVFRYCPKTPND